MKLKFKKQGYQTNAVEAVADCFAGQPKCEGLNYRLDPGRVVDASGQAVAALESAGFKNADLALTPGQMLENIHAVQRRQNLPLSAALVKTKVCDINLDYSPASAHSAVKYDVVDSYGKLMELVA